MFCSNCGTKITEDESRFCPNCGMPVVTKPNEYSSKIVFLIMGVLLLTFLGYVYFSDFNRIKSNPQVAVKLNTKNINLKNKNKKTNNDNINFNASPSNPTPSKNIFDKKESSLGSGIALALHGFRYSLDVSNSKKAKGKVIKAKMFLDGQSENDALNAFASFFAVCYGNVKNNTSYASISLLKGGKTVTLSMGIGRSKANKISAGTWQRFDKMGSQLKSFVLSNENKNPGSNESACYFFRLSQ